MNAPIGIDLTQDQLKELRKEVTAALDYLTARCKNKADLSREEQAKQDRANWEAMFGVSSKPTTEPATGSPRHGIPGIVGAWNELATDSKNNQAEHAAENILDEIAALDEAMLTLENTPLAVRLGIARLWLPQIVERLNAVKLP